MRVHFQRRRKGQQGYILLTLLLALSLMAIAAAVIVSDLKFEMKRDREEEMVHRGVQYSRAVRAYYKKFGRYPAKIEDLESTNRLRFLRKRYKDPLNCAKGTCQDFKLLRYGDPQLAMGGGLGIPGATMTGPNASVGLAPGNGLGGSSFSGLGQSQNNPQNPTNSDAAQGSTDSGQSGTQNATNGPGGTNPNGTSPSGFGSSPFGSVSSNNLTGTTFGGAPIVGVASDLRCPPHKKEECETIREYDKKKKYNEWKFIYDPSMDRGFLITTPYQQQIPGFGQAPNLNGQINPGSSGFGNGGLGNSGFGNSGFGNSSFGNSSGFGNSFGSSPGFGNSPSAGFGNQNPPPSQPPQQQ